MGASFPSDDALGVDKPRDKSAPRSSHCSSAFDRWARFGDVIECEVQNPFRRMLRVRLNTPEACAYGNELIAAGRWRKAVDDLKVGDDVEVLDEGLAMLRRLCPDQPPNHHGRIEAIDGDTITVEFPIDGSYDGHSQSAPYPRSEVRKR